MNYKIYELMNILQTDYNPSMIRLLHEFLEWLTFLP